jgi:septal ring factor EnvC (AmiA/AmiB activator)
MALGMDKIKKVLELINQIKDQMVELRDRIQEIENTINDMDERMEAIESSTERQEDLLTNLADRDEFEGEADVDEEKK